MQEAAQLSEAGAWLANLGKALDARDIPGALELFVEDCYWRDFLSLTWNIKTMEGKPAIASMLEATLERASPTEWTIEKVGRTAGVIEAWFAFTTRAGRGRGILRLEDGRCRTILTTLQSLHGFEEPLRFARPLGTTHRATRGRPNWTEKLAADQAALGVSAQPYCLIIGGGQGGIMFGAQTRSQLFFRHVADRVWSPSRTDILD
jgi:putative flavoprotein involved in K+ transport